MWKQDGAREGGWVVGQAGGEADVSGADDELHTKTVPSMPLLQPGAGRGREGKQKQH